MEITVRKLFKITYDFKVIHIVASSMEDALEIFHEINSGISPRIEPDKVEDVAKVALVL